MKTERLLIRTDAAPHIGSGHAMRCLALAQAAKDYGMNVVFVMKESADFIEKRLSAEGCQIAHITNDADLDSFDADHIVVDGYQFDARYQDDLKKRGFRVLFLDDFGHCDRYISDLVLNQNIYANESFYKNKSDNTVLLLGPKYVLLRKEFLNSLSRRERDRVRGSETRNILLTLGGFSQPEMTSRIRNALQGIDANIRTARNATNLPELMQWADIAVTAAGTTTYELAYMGVPTAMIVIADNQKRVAEAMEKQDFGINLGWHEHVTDEMIRNAIQKYPLPLKGEGKGEGWGPIDGHGSHRVLSHLFEWPLWLRRAQPDDCALLFEWANDPSTRAVSFSQKSIPWEDHEQWFQNKLNNPNCHIFIGMDHHDHPIGQIRFDAEDNAAEVDINLAPKHRGKGLGPALIDMGIQRIFATTDISRVHALIKKENSASLHAFKKAGFNPTTTGTPCPPATCRLSRHRADCPSG